MKLYKIYIYKNQKIAKRDPCRCFGLQDQIIYTNSFKKKSVYKKKLLGEIRERPEGTRLKAYRIVKFSTN